MVDAATWDGVLVRYGQAMTAAQGMERAMFALLLVRQQADAIAAGEDHTDIDKVVKFVRATPGTLIGELTERGLVEDEGLAHRLREAKKAQDLLAHWYLRDHESAARRGCGWSANTPPRRWPSARSSTPSGTTSS